MRDLELTSEQQAFLNHDPSHHARVLAGPGTGKSFTSVVFLERLASEYPDLKARMLTFTRAATAEFAQKMGDAELEGLGVAPPATVHSFALSVLMKTHGSGLPMPLRIPDSWEAKKLVQPHLSRRLRADGHRDATPTVVEKLELEMAAGWESLDPQQELYCELRPELRSAYTGLWSRHRMVFGYVLLAELPYRAGLVLEDVGADAVDLDVLLVDEYQDLNEADIKMIRLVAEGGISVLAIGDDDQSIYSFRMAAPVGIRRFLQEFDTKCDYPLSVSRRCGRAILTAANSLIQSEPGRPAKPPLVSTPQTPEGCFAHLKLKSSEAEVAGVARIIASRIAQGVPPAKIAVLVRSNLDRWATALRPALEARDISLASTEWVTQALQEDHELRRGIAFSHLVLEHTDSLSWWTLLHLASGVGPSFIDYVYENCSEEETFGEALLRLHEVGYPSGPAATRIVAGLVKDTLNALQEIDLEAVALDDRGWAGWLLDQLDRSLLSDEAVELIETVGQNVLATDGLETLLRNLEPLGKDLAASSIDAVRMMTMGRSKGLTLNTVIVMGSRMGWCQCPRPRERLTRSADCFTSP